MTCDHIIGKDPNVCALCGKSANEVREENMQCIPFCPGCFGSEDNSSWGSEVSLSYCYNCGGGPTVLLPRWAIRSIRQQASWVGKRYYPNEEDLMSYDELGALRKKVTLRRYPGRTAMKTKEGDWEVRQYLYKDCYQVTSVKARTKRSALNKVKAKLPYVPRSELKKTREEKLAGLGGKK